MSRVGIVGECNLGFSLKGHREGKRAVRYYCCKTYYLTRLTKPMLFWLPKPLRNPGSYVKVIANKEESTNQCRILVQISV
jgi:hypothetical protein